MAEVTSADTAGLGPAEMLGELERRARASAGRPVVLVDGGSGSGKTTVGAALAAALGATLVRLDDMYPGWDGLQQASSAVAAVVLARHRVPRWDWTSNRPKDVLTVDPRRPLVVEGSGSLSAANRAMATFGIWIDLAEDERKRRALQRDGEAYALHWERWAAQERAFFARERPDLLADVRVDGRLLLE
ncbi:MAG: ATP-binding protein [Naasia sp.]|nr:ATP-binding protein [Naasia sp.]